jgi:hypothetical protein
MRLSTTPSGLADGSSHAGQVGEPNRVADRAADVEVESGLSGIDPEATHPPRSAPIQGDAAPSGLKVREPPIGAPPIVGHAHITFEL